MSPDPCGCGTCDPCNMVGYPRTGGGGGVGPGTPTEVAFFDSATTITSDPQFFWDNVTKNLLIGDPLTGSVSARLAVNTPAGSSAAFLIQKTSAPNDFFAVASSTGAAGTLAPLFFGHRNASTTDPSLWFLGTLAAAVDVVGTEAVVWFMARVGDSSGGGAGTVVNAPLFRWFNNSSEVMVMTAAGFLGINNPTPTSYLDVGGPIVCPDIIITTGSLEHDGTNVGFYATSPVVQAAAIAAAAGGVVIDVQARAAINALLVAMQASTGVGLIAG